MLDFIARAAAPIAKKKADGNRFRPPQDNDLITNETHTETFKEEESADDDCILVWCSQGG